MSTLTRIKILAMDTSLFIAIAFSALVVVHIAILYISHPYVVPASDLIARVGAADMARTKELSELYDLDIQLEHQRFLTPHIHRVLPLPYRYAPFMLLLYIPYTWMSFFTAYWVHAWIQVLLLGVISICIKTIYPNLSYRGLWVLFPFIFYPFLNTIISGQISIYYVILVFSYLYVEQQHSSFFSGLISGLFLDKIHYLIFLVPLLFIFSYRKTRFIYGVMVSLFLLVWISILLVGIQGLIKYPHFLLQTEKSEYGSRVEDMTNLYSVIRMYAPFISPIVSLCFLGVGYALFLVILFFNRSSLSVVTLLSTHIWLIPLFFPHTLDHDLSLWIFPLCSIFSEGVSRWKKNGQATILFLGIAVLFFMSFLPFMNIVLRIACAIILFSILYTLKQGRECKIYTP